MTLLYGLPFASFRRAQRCIGASPRLGEICAASVTSAFRRGMPQLVIALPPSSFPLLFILGLRPT
jgi:hypothetical protein